MKYSNRLVCVAAILSLSILACSLSDITSGVTGGDSNQVLFQDDFSDPESGWQILREGQDVIDFENGGFRIFINETQFDYWSTPGLNFTDVHIEVDVTKIAGPDDNDFGILCRYRDENHFYGALISSDGYYGISKMKDGEHTILGAEGMEFSDTIQTGSTTNRIGADCIGNRIVLYVNGEKLAEIEDDEYGSGDIGLVAGTFETPGVDVVFDNVIVSRP
jgi:hypothetical protein